MINMLALVALVCSTITQTYLHNIPAAIGYFCAALYCGLYMDSKS